MRDIISKLKKILSSFIKGNSNGSLILKNFSWIFSGKIFYAISNLVISIVITRCLGPKDNGVFNYVLAFTTLFSAVSGMGLEEVIVKEFNIETDKSGGILFSGFVLKLCGGVAACILSIVSACILGMTYDKIVYVAIISVSFIFQSFDVVLYWFQSQSCNKTVVLCQNAIRAIFIILKLLLAVGGGTLFGFVIITALETIMLSASLPVVYKYNSIKTNTPYFSREILKKLFRLSWPMILSSVASSVYMKIDQVMIGQSLGDYELGIYSVAVKLAESWYFIPMGIAASVLPFLAKAYKQSEEKMYEFLQIYADGMTLMAYIISIGIAVFSKAVIWLLFGEEYLAADSLLVLYVWSGIFVNFGLIRSGFISVKECTVIGMHGTIIGAVGNIILNICLIPVMGAQGAVWATIITQMLASFISSFLFKETRKLASIEWYSLFPFIRIFKVIKGKIFKEKIK